MNQDPKTVLTRVLEIIDYPHDKEEFIKEFYLLCYEKALLTYISSLPSKEQKELKAKLPTVSNEEKTLILDTLSGQDEFKEFMEGATREVFADYIKTIFPTLTEEQCKNLQDYLNSLAVEIN